MPPIVMQTAGDEYTSGCQILAFLWVGATTAGDTAVVRHRGEGGSSILWEGRTDLVNTYQGANLGPSGVRAPGGFELSQISAGRVLVYLKEA